MTAYDAVDGSSTGIAMCQIAVSFDYPRMSPIGTLPTFRAWPQNVGLTIKLGHSLMRTISWERMVPPLIGR